MSDLPLEYSSNQGTPQSREWREYLIGRAQAYVDEFSEQIEKFEIPGVSDAEQKELVTRIRAFKGRLHCRVLVASAAGFDPLIDVSDLAAIIGITRANALRWIREGVIPLNRYEVGGVFKLLASDVRGWLQTLKVIIPPHNNAAMGKNPRPNPRGADFRTPASEQREDTDTSKIPKPPVPVSLRKQ